MKIEHLREYIALARTLNFSATARYLNISQPVLSSHIKAIEQELGVELLSRNQHRVRLNKSGQITYEHALRIVEQYDAMSRSLDDYMSSISSTLTIGYLYNAYKNILPRTTSSFSNEHPSIGISLESLSFRDLHKALREGELDIALTLDVDESLHEFYEVKTLSKDRICCVVRRDDPLAAKQSLSLLKKEKQKLSFCPTGSILAASPSSTTASFPRQDSNRMSLYATKSPTPGISISRQEEA